MDQNVLSRVLASMWRPNGEPDLSLRRANLAALIQSLTPDEANFLKELMNRDPRSGRDPAAKFPVDIWILIADSLGTRDYVSALAVSRQWRSIWSEDAVARKIAMNNYPALLLSTEEPSKSIRDAIVQCHRLAEAQRHGIYKSVVAAKAQFRDEETFRMHPKCLFPVRHTSLQIQGCGHDPVCPVATQDPDDDRYTRLNPDTFLGCAQIVIRYYASGRIAWQSVFCSHDDAFDHEHNRHVNPIIVDELATRARRLYYPRGPDFPCRWVKLAALGDKFVVALSWPHHGSRTVVAWTLDDASRRFHATLPHALRHVYTSGSRVAMTVWDTSRLYLWNVGGATLRIDLQPGPEFIDLFAESILLHPFEQDTIFLCCIITGEFCGCRVAEYRGRTYIASYYTSGAPLSGHPISVPGFSDTLPPGRSSRCIRQANSEGLYTIAHFIAEKDSDDRSRQAAALYSVQFNIFTRSFSYLWHQIERLGVGVAPDIEYLWVWGDILMFVMLPGFWGAFHRRIRANGLEGIQTDIPDSGAWLAGIRGNKWLARPGDFSGHERHKDKPQFDFMLSVRQEDLGQEPLPDHSQTFQFVGVDEHYIVLWLHRRMVVVDWGS